MSTGCNRLISDNKAVLLQSTDDFIAHMGWETKEKETLPVQQELFPDLSEEGKQIFSALERSGSMHVNKLAIELNTPVPELFMTLLELEVKNLVESLPGGMYKLT